MAKRYIGDAVVTIRYRDRGDYAGVVSIPGAGEGSWKFADLHAPPVGLGSGVAYDSPKAYDEMAGTAVVFGLYYTSHNRGDDTPRWAPRPRTADAIAAATEWAMDDSGRYDVRRKK